jgi:nucleotide-binding universal stress UspA family protein
MINKILVAVDQSPNNKLIFDTAISLAQKTETKLMLLHVMSKQEADYPTLPTFSYADYPLLDELDYNTYQENMISYQQRGIDLLLSLTKAANAAGVSTESTQLTGDSGRMICQLAENWSADLILVGSRGLKGLKEMFLGSVSNYVTHHAPCSVLIVRNSIRNPIDFKSSQESFKARKTSKSATFN